MYRRTRYLCNLALRATACICMAATLSMATPNACLADEGAPTAPSTDIEIAATDESLEEAASDETITSQQVNLPARAVEAVPDTEPNDAVAPTEQPAEISSPEGSENGGATFTQVESEDGGEGGDALIDTTPADQGAHEIDASEPLEGDGTAVEHDEPVGSVEIPAPTEAGTAGDAAEGTVDSGSSDDPSLTVEADSAPDATASSEPQAAPVIDEKSAPQEAGEPTASVAKEQATASREKTVVQAMATSTQPKAGTYLLRWALQSKMVLDVSSGKLVKRESNSTITQRFVLKKTNDGWTITSSLDGKTANSRGTRGSTVLMDATKGLWRFESYDGKWLIRSLATGLLLGASKDSNSVTMQNLSGSDLSSALWGLVTAPSLAKQSEAPKAGYYRLVTSSGKQMDIQGAKSANGTKVITYKSNSGANQIFRLEVTKDGFVRIHAGDTNKVVSTGTDLLTKGGTATLQQANNRALDQLFRFKKAKDGSWSVYDLATGKQLGVVNSAISVGSSGNWRLKGASNFAPLGIREIGLHNANTMRLDVRRESLQNGAEILQWNNSGGQNQKWEIVRTGTNTYTIQNVRSGLYLSRDKNGKAIQSKVATTFNIYPLINSWGIQVPGTGLRLGVKGSSGQKGAEVCYTKSGWNDGQQFDIKWSSPLADGVYAIEIKANRGTVVGVSSQSLNNGTNVKTLKWTGKERTSAGNEKWRFTRNSDGSYTIVNSYSCKALDASRAKPKDGANVAQWTSKGAANQRWKLVYNHDGSFKLVNVGNPNVVLSAGGTSANSNVSVNADKSQSTQRFAFKKAEYLTGDAELDEIIEGMLTRCGTGEKGLRKAYDEIATYKYVRMNTYPKGNWRTWSIAYAKQLYRNGQGNCYRYNSLMCWYARAIGYESTAISGEIWLGDHWAAHGWAEIIYGGKKLVLDPRQGGYRAKRYGDNIYRCYLAPYKEGSNPPSNAYPYRTRIVSSK